LIQPPFISTLPYLTENAKRWETWGNANREKRQFAGFRVYSGIEVNDETYRGVMMPKPFTLPGLIPSKLTKYNNMKLKY